MAQAVLEIKTLYHTWQKAAQLEVVFQPLVRLPTGIPFGYEALSRPLIGQNAVPIGLLLESASMSQQLADFDRAALPAILKAATALKFPSDQKLFINFSPFTLLDPDFVLGAIMNPDVQISPAQVVIEISEREALPGMNLAQLLAPYRNCGMSIALDDFGAGYSGLTRVVDLNPDFAKVDLSLVRDIDKNSVKYSLVESTVQFASRSGHLQILAEGVETQAELATLHELGVTLGQGYLFGRPAPRLSHVPQTVDLGLLTRRLPDPAELLQAFITTTHRMADGVGMGEGLASHVVHLAARLTAADQVVLWTPEGSGLTVQYAFPALPEALKHPRLDPRYPSYRAMTERHTIVFQTEEECASSPVATQLGMRSLLMVPVVDSTHTRALLTVGFLRPLQIRPQEIQITEGLARLMALVTSVPAAEGELPGVGEPVFEAISSLVASGDLDSLLSKVMEAALSVSGGHLGWIGVVTPEYLHAVTAEGEYLDISLAEIYDASTDNGRGPIGRSLRERRMVVVQDIAEDPTLDPWREEMLADGIQAALAIPLVSQGNVVGLLKVYHSHTNGFEIGRIRRLEALASLATVLIDKWQEEHYATRHWLKEKSETVFHLIRELATATSAAYAYRRIEATVRELFGGYLSGVVQFDHDRVVQREPATELDDLRWSSIQSAVLQVRLSRCTSSLRLEGEDSLFAMPLLLASKAIGAIWVVYKNTDSRIREDASDLLSPHLITLSLAGAASMMLESQGF